jgi:mono/diheme cytochrome c family protein
MRRSLVLLTAMALGACKGHEFHPPDKTERVTAAEQNYQPATFDSIQWASPAARLSEGNNVYASKCRKCHGPTGEGDTEYAHEQKLEPPSLVAADWKYATSIDSVRHRIFVGHASGMPSFGMGAITPREIDAAAHYILEQLRPDMAKRTAP